MLRYNHYKNTYNSIKYGGAETAVEPPIIYHLDNGQRFSGPSVQLYPSYNFYEHSNHRPDPNYDVTVYRTNFSTIGKDDRDVYDDSDDYHHRRYHPPPILFEGRAYWNEQTKTLDPIKGCNVKAYDCHGNWFIGRAKRIILRDFEHEYHQYPYSIESFRDGTRSGRPLKNFDAIIPDAWYLVQNNMQGRGALGSNVSGIVDFDETGSRYYVRYSSSELENLCEDQIETIRGDLGLNSPTMSRGPESHRPSPVSPSSSPPLQSTTAPLPPPHQPSTTAPLSLEVAPIVTDPQRNCSSCKDPQKDCSCSISGGKSKLTTVSDINNSKWFS